MASTINYGWDMPTVGSDDNSWGITINDTTISIDSALKAVDNVARGVNATANPSSWQKVSSGNIASGASKLELTLSEPYRAYNIILQNIAPVNNNVAFYAKFANSGLNWVSLAGYSYAGSYQTTAPTAGTFGNSAQTDISILPINMGNSSLANSSIEFTIFNDARSNVMMWRGVYVDHLQNYVNLHGVGRMGSGSMLSAIQFSLGSGVFSSGGHYLVSGAPHL